MAAFDLNAALAGATLVVAGHDTWIVTDFGKASAGAPLPYQAVVKGKITYFSYAGVSRDSTMTLLLSDVQIDDSIASTRGDTITRGSDAAYTLTSLSYREQVAVRMLEAMLPTMGNALSFDDGKIKNLVTKAFYIATEFTNQAIGIRNANSNEQETGINVDPSKLTDYTDKLLYNISQTLKNGIAVKGETVAAGGTATPVITKLHPDSEIKKVAEVTEIKKVTEITDVKKVSQMPTTTVQISGTPNVNVSNSPTVNLASGSSVSVSNMLSEPVSVTGTVNVGNWPEEEQV